MIWAVLIGNTRLVAGLMKNGAALQKIATPTSSVRSAAGALKWARSLRRRSGSEGVMVASVVPPVDAIVRKALRASFGRSPLFLTYRNAGIGVKVRKPFEVGADRLANALAARELFGAPSIVADYGTGTTFDVVDKRGCYRGGAILPGLGISLRALHEFTAKIPLVRFQKAGRALGRDTLEAVRSGIYHGAIGATRELLTGIRRELGAKAPAIATGGWCHVFSDSKLFRLIEPDLTLKGLELAWNKLRGVPPRRYGERGEGL